MFSPKTAYTFKECWAEQKWTIWTNARYCAYIPTDVHMWQMYVDIVHLFVVWGISFDVRSFTAYMANIGELRTNMNERVRSCLLQSPYLANAHVRLCLAEHICQVCTRLKVNLICRFRTFFISKMAVWPKHGVCVFTAVVLMLALGSLKLRARH